MSDPAKITVEGSPINLIKINLFKEDGKCYAKLFQVDLLKKLEKEDLLNEA